jgi:hypothetical protein
VPSPKNGLGVKHLALLTLTLLAAVGCGDKVVRLSYLPPPPTPVLQPKLVIVGFEDQRGSEGDGNQYRVGGIYGGYGNRLAKVYLNEPWPPKLLSALVAEFRAAGVDAAGLEHLSA